MGYSGYPNDQQTETPPPQKYELPEEDQKTGLLKRFSVGLLISGVFLLLKDVLFSWGETAAARADSVPNIDPGSKNIGPPSLVLIETPEQIDQAAFRQNASPNRANSPSTSIDNFSTVERPIYAEPVQARPGSGLSLAVTIGKEPTGPAVGSDVNDLPPQIGGRIAGSGRGVGRGGFDGIPKSAGDTAPDGPRPAGNRAPIVTRPARLNSLLVDQTVIIATAGLLQNVTDADGDVLSIQNLAASSGNLVDTGVGIWLFTPDLNDTTEVTFTYDVTDGTESTPQTALLDLLPLPDEALAGTDAPATIAGTPSDDIIDAHGGDETVVAHADEETINGDGGDNRIMGGEGDDVIFGGAGDDTILGGDGDDTIFGGDGNDVIRGESGRDLIFAGAGDDIVHGGDGDDQIFATVLDGDDSYSGGAGTDTYDLSETAADAIIDLATGTANSSETGHDSLFKIENVVGGAGHDTIFGSNGDNVLQGGPGSDEIDGGAGDDQIVATVSDGDDSYSGGAGADTYDLSGTEAGVVVDLTSGTADGTEIGHDTLSSVENVVGGAGDDTIFGSSGNNVLQGGPGSDEIDGGAGDDQLIATISDGDDSYSGGAGTDTYDLSGTEAGVVVDLALGTADGAETGHDTLAGIENVVGGAGDDVFKASKFFNVFTGGGGNDIFEFGGIMNSNALGAVRDQITDFQVGDRIDLSGFDALLMLAGIPDFELVVDKLEFSDSGRVEVRFQGFGEDERTVVEVTIDDNGEFETEIELHGRHDLTKDDFIGVS